MLLKWLSREREKDRNLHLQIAQLQTEAVERIARTIAKSQESMLEAVKETTTKNADVLNSWLEGFKTVDVPVSSVMRDIDEVRDVLGADETTPEFELARLLNIFESQRN